jgi:hypothetical protein
MEIFAVEIDFAGCVSPVFGDARTLGCVGTVTAGRAVSCSA